MATDTSKALPGRVKKRVFQKIVFNKATDELEEGEIISDNEDSIDGSGSFQPVKKRAVTCKPKLYEEREDESESSSRKPPIRERLGFNPNREVSAFSDDENADDKSGFMSEFAQLKADLSELLFVQPNRTIGVGKLSAAFRSFFNKVLDPEDYDFPADSMEDLLFALNLFSLRWESGERVMKWDQGKFLANFKENAEDLLQAKECIPLNQFLPLYYLSVFGHNITEGEFLDMCGYPSTAELLTACCPSIWVPEFGHQMLQMCDTGDYSGNSNDLDYDQKICYFFRKGWCKFGKMCRYIH